MVLVVEFLHAINETVSSTMSFTFILAECVEYTFGESQ